MNYHSQILLMHSAVCQGYSSEFYSDRESFRLSKVKLDIYDLHNQNIAVNKRLHSVLVNMDMDYG